MGQNGASVRVALAADGTVYGAYFGLRDFTRNILTSDVVVVRDDHFGKSAAPFTDLADADHLPGRRVVSGIKIPWSTGSELDQERIGSTLALAVAPNDSATVYVAWGDRVGSGDVYTIHLRRSNDRGVSWSGDLRTITNATCIALAVAGNGTAAFLYQAVSESSRGRLWVTHLEQSSDQFNSVKDTVLSAAPATLTAQFLPYLGDYTYLTAVGEEFRGVFAANNLPDLQDFPSGVTYQRHANFTRQTLDDGLGNVVPVSIDPFYFSVPVMR